MLDLIASIPRAVLVIGCLVAGLALIVFNNPPQTACHTQLEVIKGRLIPVLYPDPKHPALRVGLTKAIVQCKTTNTPGGCLDLFDSSRKIIKEAATIPSDCVAEASEQTTLKGGITAGIDLMVELAWGGKTPAEPGVFSWFDSEHIDVFCKLNRTYKNIFGEEAWSEYINAKLAQLIGQSQLDRAQVWARTPFSKCIL